MNLDGCNLAQKLVCFSGRHREDRTLRSRIERKYCLISTSYLAEVYDIFMFLHV